MAAVVLALAAAALWGPATSSAASRRGGCRVLIVLFWSQLVGLAGLVVWIARQRLRPAGCRPPLRGRPRASPAPSGSAASTAAWRSARWASSRRSPRPPRRAARVSTSSAATLAGGACSGLGIALALAGIVLVSREPGGARRARCRGRRRPRARRRARLRAVRRRARRGRAGERSWAIATARLGSVTRARRSRSRWTRTVPRVSRPLLPLILAVGRLRHGRERADRGRDDARLDRDRRRPQRALPDRDDPARPRRPARAARRRRAPRGGLDRARRRRADRGVG